MAVLNLRALICIIGLKMAIHIHGNEAAVAVPKNSHYTGSDIIVGIGYSEDTQQLTTEKCYNGIKISTSDQQSYVKLSQASSSSEIEREFGISASLGGSYDDFSASATASYLRSLAENEYAMSLNYYEYSSNKVTVQLAGPGDKALSNSGKSLYNNGTNPHFGLICGDHYVSSYQQGAVLIMGLYIKLNSSAAKREFGLELGISFGSIISATASIKTAHSKSKFTGSITIQAFQIGGEPSKLSQVFEKSSNGEYYALTCSFTTIDDCIQAASSLLDYATNNFATQFSFEKNIGLSPLGIAYTEYQSIEFIGLTPPVSRVTHEVAQYRNELSNKLRENKYYQQKIYPFVSNGYPVKLVDTFLSDATSFSSKVNDNLHLLMQSHGGAADCYNNPDECKSTKTSIDSQLKNITFSDLTFLNDIKYMLTFKSARWFNTGENTKSSWGITYPKPLNNEFLQPMTVNSISVTSEEFKFDVVSINGYWGHTYDGKAISNMTYDGKFCNKYPEECYEQQAGRVLSPWFFELYNKNTDDAINDPNPSVHKKNRIRLNIVVNNFKNDTM